MIVAAHTSPKHISYPGAGKRSTGTSDSLSKRLMRMRSRRVLGIPEWYVKKRGKKIQIVLAPVDAVFKWSAVAIVLHTGE